MITRDSHDTSMLKLTLDLRRSVISEQTVCDFRLVLIFRYKVVSYMNIFFTCKNTLVTILQLYRLFVLCCERRGIREVSVEGDIGLIHNV